MYAGSADQSSDHTKRDIFENFKKYSLERPELIRMDNHLLDRHIHLRHNNIQESSSSSSALDRNLDFMSGMFDVIVTDPPYGIRAGAKKSGNTGANTSPLLISYLFLLHLVSVSIIHPRPTMPQSFITPHPTLIYPSFLPSPSHPHLSSSPFSTLLPSFLF